MKKYKSTIKLMLIFLYLSSQCILLMGDEEIVKKIMINMEHFHQNPVYFDLLLDLKDKDMQASSKFPDILKKNLLLRNQDFFIHDVSDYNKRFKQNFKRGDMIFYFKFEDKNKKERAIREWNLKKTKRMKTQKGKVFILYEVKSGLYLILLQKVKKWYCPMHPNKLYDKGNKCPICSMDLYEKYVYE